MKLNLLLLGLALIHVQSFGQPAVKLTVDADKPLFEIQPTMWGLFFEDINFAADGGLYAELVKNRSFEFPVPLEGWTVEGATFFSSPVHRDGEAVTGADGIYASAVRDADTKELIVKFVSNNDSPVPFELKMNSLEDSEHIVPREEPLEVSRKTLKLTLDTYSLTILKIKLK
jgi:hypothetical protein